MDWNEVIDSFADLVASKVAAKLRDADGSNWPNVETKKTIGGAPPLATRQGIDLGFPNTDPATLLNRIANIEVTGYGELQQDDPGDEDVQPEPEAPESPAKQNGRKAERREHWRQEPVGEIRAYLAGYEGADIAKYKAMSKAKLVDYAADLETLTGHDLDDIGEPDVTEPQQNEMSQNDDDELTYDEALTLELAELKQIARDNGLSDEVLEGLDIDAVADLLFDVNADTEITQEELLDMSRDELEGIARELKIEYDDSISRQDLAMLIVDSAAESE